MDIRLARLEDAEGIVRVCTDAYRHTYPGIIAASHIEKTIKEFYNLERVEREITDVSDAWNGWFVAVDNGQVVGAAGGGFTADSVAELFVIYLDPARKREGIGSRLLTAVTDDQRARGAKEQWVSVQKYNDMGIPFYEAVGFEYQEERPAHGYSEEEGYRSLRYKRRI
ncbi:GNAT family N-acetyltransferase [Paenalkalicoccus suaedae]|nr:GNAT family N-acetyltransferase [Paenalkalicoccus suaedae]